MYTVAERAERRKTRAHLSVEIPRTQHEQMKEIAKSKDETLSRLIRKIISNYLSDIEG